MYISTLGARWEMETGKPPKVPAIQSAVLNKNPLSNKVKGEEKYLLVL